MTAQGSREPRGGGLALALAWAFVALPLAWGVAQTVAKSLALFSR